MNTLNIGIVGFGHVVLNAHLPILRVLKGVKIKWVLDPDPKEAGLLNHLNISRLSSIDELQDFPETDIVRDNPLKIAALMDSPAIPWQSCIFV